MTEPTTEAGRRLLDANHPGDAPTPRKTMAFAALWGSILAIEAEARADALREDVLAKALDAHMADFLEQPESFDHSALVAANVIQHYRSLLQAEPTPREVNPE